MKVGKIALLTAIFISGSTQAAVDLKYSGFGKLDENACSQVLGDWKGDGKVSAFLILQCNYTGSGRVTIRDKCRLNVHVDLHTASMWPCRDVTVDLPATCRDGKFTIATDQVHLTGVTDGKSAHFENGTIKFAGITANIDYINLTR